ncbi:hypothetical protein IWW45_006774, partial [Coemansia sp. RSA 485]
MRLGVDWRWLAYHKHTWLLYSQITKLRFQSSVHRPKALSKALCVLDRPRIDVPKYMQTRFFAQKADNGSADFSERDAEVWATIESLTRLLGQKRVDVAEVWSCYDRLKIRRMLLYLPYEAWAQILKTCQWATSTKAGPDDKGKSKRKEPLFPIRESRISKFSKEFSDRNSLFWTRSMSKRRALMILSDMHRVCYGKILETDDMPFDGQENAHVTKQTAQPWKPSAIHYNIVLDVICRDKGSDVAELAAVHQRMRSCGVREDTVTFNTLLNGCRALGAWDHFREIEAHMLKRSEWGVTRMDATTWGTLLQGYIECRDWASVDRCISRVKTVSEQWCIATLPLKGGAGAEQEGAACQQFVPTTQLWATVINAYAMRDMIGQMIEARMAMSRLGIRLNAHVFGPIFAALHRMRKSLVGKQRDPWPAAALALDEFAVLRANNAAVNPVILTNVLLTIGLGRECADVSDPRMAQKLAQTNEETSKELESLVSKARDPNVYAALLNINAKTRNYSDIRALWQTLVLETRLSSQDAPPVLTPRTLAAYMNALISCRAYEDAITAFYDHASTQPQSFSDKPSLHMRSAPAPPRLKAVDLSVYEAAAHAFARAGRHRMCPRLIQTLINNRIRPSALIIRYSLLSPDNTVPTKNRSVRYTRPWTLPLSIARDIWNSVIAVRQNAWIYERKDSQPVIVNDIAAQLIRVAAYARNVEFGEEVFDALAREAEHYGIGYGEGNTHRRDALPDYMQCAPNVRTYTSMITLYANNADLSSISRLWAKMLQEGIEPNLHTYTSLIVCLHKVSLRKRWKRSREYIEENEFGQAHSGDGLEDLLAPTSQDKMLAKIEDWVVNWPSKAPAADELFDAEHLENGAPPDIDIPFSTLLLRYHAMYIRDLKSNGHLVDKARVDKIANEYNM